MFPSFCVFHPFLLLVQPALSSSAAFSRFALRHTGQVLLYPESVLRVFSHLFTLFDAYSECMKVRMKRHSARLQQSHPRPSQQHQQQQQRPSPVTLSHSSSPTGFHHSLSNSNRTKEDSLQQKSPHPHSSEQYRWSALISRKLLLYCSWAQEAVAGNAVIASSLRLAAQQIVNEWIQLETDAEQNREEEDAVKEVARLFGSQSSLASSMTRR